ncbi:MAG: hypothetical protein AB7T37_14395, partial [Dehalococcoidia bacterium]
MPKRIDSRVRSGLQDGDSESEIAAGTALCRESSIRARTKRIARARPLLAADGWDAEIAGGSAKRSGAARPGHGVSAAAARSPLRHGRAPRSAAECVPGRLTEADLLKGTPQGAPRRSGPGEAAPPVVVVGGGAAHIGAGRADGPGRERARRSGHSPRRRWAGEGR